MRAGWAAALMAALLVAAPAHADSAGQQLAGMYSPVLMLEPQAKPCGSGEAYRPTSVDIVLGRQDVLLRDPRGKVVKRGPTGRDLWGLANGYYVDMPGNPLKPGCKYETEFRDWNDGRRPTVYAHIATDPERPGKLALQYWFYYTFNDFTDKHEGDWEMAQLDFNAPSAEAALHVAPYEMDLSQHAGGERSAWAGAKVQKRGTHPVIYDATGSHANYFNSALYLGRGAKEGFGCDRTRDATQPLSLQAVLLPDVIPASALDPYAWLAFHGRWGQKERGINNGPTGPGVKDQWLEPIRWSEGLRTTSVEVPTGRTVGVSVGNFFCGAVTQGAVMFNWSLLHPVPFVVLLLAVLAGLGLSVAMTTWHPAEPEPMRMEREGGQIFRATSRIYASNLSIFVATGAIFVPVSLLAAAIQWVVFHLTSVAPLVALDGRHGSVTAFLALMIGGVGGLFASVIATAAVAVILNEVDSGRPISAAHAYRRVFRHLRPLGRATLAELGMALVLTISVVGIPFAIHRFIRWSLFAEASVLGNLSAGESLRRSSELVRGRWWRTFGFTALVDVAAVLSGPMLGVGLLLLTDRSLEFINLAASLVYTFTVPYAAIQLTLYYFDLETRGR